MTSDMFNELIYKLKKVLDDYDFVAGVIGFCETDRNAKDIIDKLDRKELTSSDDILLYAATLSSNIEFIER